MKCIRCPKIKFLVSIFILVIMPAACGTTTTLQRPESVRPFPANEERYSSGVALGPADLIEIKFAYAPQFDQTETVRPDGKIELALLGEVSVQGKTPARLREELMRLYAAQLRHPQLAVIIKKLWDRRVSVCGEVKYPGAIPMPGRMTALEAIIAAGGFITATAELKNVIVVRSVNGHTVARAIDLEGPLNGVETKPFYLKPRDVVYVPQTRIANVDQWVNQHLWDVLPKPYVSYSPSTF